MFGVSFVSLVPQGGAVMVFDAPVTSVRAVALGSLGNQKVKKIENFKLSPNSTKSIPKHPLSLPKGLGPKGAAF